VAISISMRLQVAETEMEPIASPKAEEGTLVAMKEMKG